MDRPVGREAATLGRGRPAVLSHLQSGQPDAATLVAAVAAVATRVTATAVRAMTVGLMVFIVGLLFPGQVIWHRTYLTASS